MNFVAHHPVLLLVAPLAFAAVCPLLGIRFRRLCFPFALVGLLATDVFTWSLIWKVGSKTPISYSIGSWGPPWGIQVRVDTQALLLACAITGVCSVLLVYSRQAIEDSGKGSARPAYGYSLFLVATAAMLGVLLAGDIFNMLVFLTVTGVAVCGLLALSADDRGARPALEYLLTVAATGAVLILSVGFLYSVTGALDMKKIALRLGTMDHGFVPVAALALGLFVAGLAVKSAVWPASWWLRRADDGSFEPGAAMLSGLAVFAAAFAMYRLLFTVFPPSLTSLDTARTVATVTLGWLGAAAVLAGAVIAAFHVDTRKILSYTAVSQAGLVALGLAVSNTRSVAGGLFAATGAICAVTGLFLSLGTFGPGTVVPRGAGHRNPVGMTAFVLAGMSLVGVPWTAGFSAKRLIVTGLFDRSWYVPAALVFLGTAVTLFYLSRMAWVMMKPDGFEAPEEGSPPKAPLVMSLAALFLGVGGVALGIVSYLITPVLR